MIDAAIHPDLPPSLQTDLQSHFTELLATQEIGASFSA